MTHTFLFEPGIWTGAGTFWTEDGKPTPAEGRTEITHRRGLLAARRLAARAVFTARGVRESLFHPAA